MTLAEAQAAEPLVITIQSGPRNARTDESGLRFYTWQGRELPSVTTVRRMAGMPHNLHQWAVSQVIKRATGNVWTLVKMLTRKRRPRERVLEKNRVTEAGKWLRAAATEERDAAAKLGTTVHDAAAGGFDINLVEEAARPRLLQFRAWLAASGAEILATEFQVFNLAVGYAGTGDLLVRFRDGSIWLLDLKTGKGTYSEHALQLVAYLMAEFSGSDDLIDEQVTQLLRCVQGIAILHLADDHWEFRRVRPDTATFTAFRGLLVFAMWMREHDDVDAVTSRLPVAKRRSWRRDEDVSVVLAIDPGPERSAWLVYNPTTSGIRSFGLYDNAQLLASLRGDLSPDVGDVVIEKIEAFGMAVGAEVFETVFWTGRFAEAAEGNSRRVDRIGRKAVKIHICGSMRAKDPNIRQALIDRFGGAVAIGRKAAPGPLYGIVGDVWSALAVGVTWADQHA